MLGGSADTKGQDNARVDPATGLTDLSVGGEQFEILSDFPGSTHGKAFDSESISKEIFQGGEKPVQIVEGADSISDIDDKVCIGKSDRTRKSRGGSVFTDIS